MVKRERHQIGKGADEEYDGVATRDVADGRELVQQDDASGSLQGRVWRPPPRGFTLNELKSELAELWSIPLELLTIVADHSPDPQLELWLPDGAIIRWLTRG